MPTTQRFFANIKSMRDNGSPIEMNLRGTHYHSPGKFSGPREDCHEAESETTITECQVLKTRKGTNKYWTTTVDFYEFSDAAQARFIEAALGNMEADD